MCQIRGFTMLRPFRVIKTKVNLYSTSSKAAAKNMSAHVYLRNHYRIFYHQPSASAEMVIDITHRSHKHSIVLAVNSTDITHTHYLCLLTCQWQDLCVSPQWGLATQIIIRGFPSRELPRVCQSTKHFDSNSVAIDCKKRVCEKDLGAKKSRDWQLL